MAGPGDAAAIAALHLASQRVAYGGIVPAELIEHPDLTQRTRDWEHTLAAAAGPTYLLEAGGQAQGFCYVRPAPDADLLSDALSEFFRSYGWGTLTVRAVGGSALAVDSFDWAEADPGTAEAPMCFFTAGMLADFLGRLAGETVSVMEVECRSRNDARCRFLSATPAVLQQVYERMTQGTGYEEALASG